MSDGNEANNMEEAHPSGGELTDNVQTVPGAKPQIPVLRALIRPKRESSWQEP